MVPNHTTGGSKRGKRGREGGQRGEVKQFSFLQLRIHVLIMNSLNSLVNILYYSNRRARECEPILWVCERNEVCGNMVASCAHVLLRTRVCYCVTLCLYVCEWNVVSDWMHHLEPVP